MFNINQKIIFFLIYQTIIYINIYITHYNSYNITFYIYIYANFNYSSIIVNVQFETLNAIFIYGNIGVNIVITLYDFYYYSKLEFLHTSPYFSITTGNSFHLHYEYITKNFSNNASKPYFGYNYNIFYVNIYQDIPPKYPVTFPYIPLLIAHALINFKN